MADEKTPPAGPDLTHGRRVVTDFTGETLLGHVGDEDVLLVRAGDEIFAIDAHCSHYHGPLAEGLVVGDSIRCPWHHACFDLRTGEAVAGAGADPLAGLAGRARRATASSCGEKREQPKPRVKGPVDAPGRDRDRRRRRGRLCRGGDAAAAGLSRQHRHAEQRCRAAGRPAESVEGLSRRQRAGGLAAAASGQLSTPRPASTCGSTAKVASIERTAREVVLAGGDNVPYDRLLLATGAEPVRLPIPGADQPHVHVAALARRLPRHHRGRQRRAPRGRDRRELHRAGGRGRAARARASRSMWWRRSSGRWSACSGPQMGDFVRALHEEHGVIFHLERYRDRDRRQARDAQERRHAGGRPRRRRRRGAAARSRWPNRPASRSTAACGERLSSKPASPESSPPAISRAGPIRIRGDNIRVEHWVVAERQGQTAALNMLGQREPFDAVPFFWSQHYDVPINYVGHAEQWDEIAIDGDIAGRDCLLRYKTQGPRARGRLDLSRPRKPEGRARDGAGDGLNAGAPLRAGYGISTRQTDLEPIAIRQISA